MSQTQIHAHPQTEWMLDERLDRDLIPIMRSALGDVLSWLSRSCRTIGCGILLFRIGPAWTTLLLTVLAIGYAASPAIVRSVMKNSTCRHWRQVLCGHSSVALP